MCERLPFSISQRWGGWGAATSVPDVDLGTPGGNARKWAANLESEVGRRHMVLRSGGPERAELGTLAWLPPSRSWRGDVFSRHHGTAALSTYSAFFTHPVLRMKIFATMSSMAGKHPRRRGGYCETLL